MSLFDQQPMGPVPARRPVIVPADPELEGAGVDPTTASIRVMKPVPTELRRHEPLRARRHVFRYIVGSLLIVPFAAAVVVGMVGVGRPESADGRMTGPFLISFAVVGLVILGASLVARRLRGRAH